MCDVEDFNAQENFAINSFNLENQVPTNETFVISDHPAVEANRRVDEGNCFLKQENISLKSVFYSEH